MSFPVGLGYCGRYRKIVGADSLIYCPSNVKHAILNIGKTTARVLRVTGSGAGMWWGGVGWWKETTTSLKRWDSYYQRVKSIRPGESSMPQKLKATIIWKGIVSWRYRPEAALHGMVGKELAKHLMLGLDMFPPGGGLASIFMLPIKSFPVFRSCLLCNFRANTRDSWDTVKIVGTDSLIYSPSNVKTLAILNVRKDHRQSPRNCRLRWGSKNGGWVK